MELFLMNLILYTFSVYGFIVFIREILLLFNRYKKYCKVVLIVDEKNIEGILRDFSWSLCSNRSIENIYVLNKDSCSDESGIAKRYCNDNELFILADKQKIMEIINDDTY